MLTSARARRRRRAVARPSALLVLPRRKSVPLACSGLMYGAVPRMFPPVSWRAPRSSAIAT